MTLTHLEVVDASTDAVGVGALSLHVLTEDLASRDTFPLKVLRECLKVLLTAATWSTEQENATN